MEQTGGIDWGKLVRYKADVIGVFPKDLLAAAPQLGIASFLEQGKLIDAHTVQAGDQTIQGETIVIATGQRNAQLNIPGKEFVHNSRDFISAKPMPEHLICIGAGIISMGFASMALTLGKKVTFIEFAPRALAA